MMSTLPAPGILRRITRDRLHLNPQVLLKIKVNGPVSPQGNANFNHREYDGSVTNLTGSFITSSCQFFRFYHAEFSH
jgi:hypothetical protein